MFAETAYGTLLLRGLVGVGGSFCYFGLVTWRLILGCIDCFECWCWRLCLGWLGWLGCVLVVGVASSGCCFLALFGDFALLQGVAADCACCVFGICGGGWCSSFCLVICECLDCKIVLFVLLRFACVLVFCLGILCCGFMGMRFCSLIVLFILL